MSDYPALNLFWTMLWFFLWVMWLFLLFRVVSDIFRSRDLGGWSKAAWMVLCIILPFLGVLAYVVLRGHSMQNRDVEQAQQADAAFKKYVRDAAATPGAGGSAGDHVAELSKLADLKAGGALTEAEFQKAKDKLLV